jgi:histidinol-phosphate phosphatase family protein
VTAPSFSVVVPTVGRPSLSALLDALAGLPVVVVDDRPVADPPLEVPAGVRVVTSGGRGPAAARNVGWRATASEWVAFLDDDVLPAPGWARDLVRDLSGLPERVAGSQARLVVPLPSGRRPTDWERGTAGLADARWVTADMAYRRSALVRVGGFDERFRRAYREDADLALRVLDAGWELVRGERVTTHPVRPASAWASVRAQRGNTDDVRMRHLHGRDWRERAGAPAGRFRRHAAVTAFGALALTGLAGLAARSGGVGRRRGWGVAAALGGAGWLAGTAEFAWARIAPGPRTPREIATMALTSAAIPPAAVAARLRGEATTRGVRPRRPSVAVLFDRDGTLVHDVPYNGDPELVHPVDGAAEAVAWLREQGVPIGVVTNQSAVGRGMIGRADVDAVNARVAELLGPFDDWQVCPHAPGDGCDCRKPRPGMVLAAAASLGVPAQRVVVIGDIGADVAAAHAAGARAVLVPTAATRPEEVAAAPAVAGDLVAAVRLAVAGGAR